MNNKKRVFFAWIITLFIAAMTFCSASANNSENIFLNVSRPLTSEQSTALEALKIAQSSQLSPIDIDAFQNLSESDLEKINDKNLLDFVQTIRQQTDAAQKDQFYR